MWREYAFQKGNLHTLSPVSAAARNNSIQTKLDVQKAPVAGVPRAVFIASKISFQIVFNQISLTFYAFVTSLTINILSCKLVLTRQCGYVDEETRIEHF